MATVNGPEAMIGVLETYVVDLARRKWLEGVE